MRTTLKRILFGLLAAALAVAAALALYACVLVSAFDASMRRVYDVPAPALEGEHDVAALARGKQLVESVGACSAASCHGADFGGGKTTSLGPIGEITAPNITGPGLSTYSDGQLARLLRDGVKRDGRSVLFMPVDDFGWLPRSDVAAMVSYLRAVPAVDRPPGPTRISVLGKVLDRRGMVALDVARRIDHRWREGDEPPPPAPTPAYGSFLARGCMGCHGEHLSGGPFPGAPSSVAVPPNLTPDGTGMREWSFADFERVLTTGVRRDGTHLDPLMPYDAYAKYDDTQKRALWAYLRSLPPRRLGGR
jgi:hypothetical protein